MPPGPLKSPSRALFVDVGSMLANLLADMLSVFVVGAPEGSALEEDERSCGMVYICYWNDRTNYLTMALDYRSAWEKNYNVWESWIDIIDGLGNH